MLSIHHVSYAVGSNVILRDVTLDVEPKDVVCVVGDEGSGKTTLLKLLMRELQPTEGVIKVDGATMAHLPREVLRLYRMRIGYLPEEPALDPTLTIERNVALPLDLAGTPVAERDRSVADLLKRLSLTGVAARFPRAVSRGERQLAAIARTIARGPVIVLLDEPFQGIGDETAKTAATMLQNMRKKGATIVVATAEERTASFFRSARIVRLQRGKLAEDAVRRPSEEVREIARVATTELVERSTVPPPEQVDEPSAALSGRKKVRITSVGSL